jgi:hypothetical protein
MIESIALYMSVYESRIDSELSEAKRSRVKSATNSAEVRVCRPNASARSMLSGIGFFQPEGDDLVFRSALTGDASVSEHLKWLYGMLKCERKVFRQLEASGTSVVVVIRPHERKLHLTPEALLLMHQFHLSTEVRQGG